MLSNDVTLIIQGPLSIYTIFTLYRYKNDFPIVISTPRVLDMKNNKLLREINELMQSADCKISLFWYDGEWDSKIYNEQNRYSQFFSTLLALQACHTKYVVKTRSDEFYSNLMPFVDAIMENPRKLVTNDVFFRNSSMPFHPSDHLMGGKTSLITSMFSLAKRFCEDTSLVEKNVFIELYKSKIKADKVFVPAEVYLGAALLTHLHADDILVPEIDLVDVMKNNITIVDSDELGVLRIAANSVGDGKEFFDTSYRDKKTDVYNIEEYE